MNTDLRPLSPFQDFCVKFLGYVPSSYDECMTYLECLIYTYNYLKNEIVPTVAQQNVVIQEMKDYIDNYFTNLDVQEEINNKLDAMALDGTLEEIITSYIQLKGMLAFNNVAEMKTATNLVDGSFVQTLGFYSKNDGGHATYKIREITNQDIVDDALIIALDDENLIAELIIDNNVLYAKQLGCYLDKNHDDTNALQHAIDIAYSKRYDLIINGYAYVTDTIQTKGVHLIGVGTPANCYQTYTSKEYGNIGWDYLRNTGDGALITFDDYKEDVLTEGSGIISDIASPILENNYEYGEQYYGQFFLENLCICGWIRNENQIGVATKCNTGTTLTYLRGSHHFKNLNVINCGGTAIYLNSLELVELDNVKARINLGYGLYIEGISGIDSPFEYVTFNNCDFSGNKLGNIYALNSFRKNITFNNCKFYFTGLYQQLGLAIPTTTSDIVPAIKISGTESTDTATAKENILIYNCYAEDTRVLLHIDQQGLNVNNITMYNNTVLPETLHDYYCILYLNAYYCNNFSFYSNKFNGTNQLILANINQLKPRIVDKAYYTAYNPVKTPTINNSLSHMSGSTDLVTIQRYSNIVELNARVTATASIPAYTTLISNIPKPLNQCYFNAMLNDTDTIRINLYTNSIISSTQALAQNDIVSFHLVYFTEYNVDK